MASPRFDTHEGVLLGLGENGLGTFVLPCLLERIHIQHAHQMLVAYCRGQRVGTFQHLPCMRVLSIKDEQLTRDQHQPGILFNFLGHLLCCLKSGIVFTSVEVEPEVDYLSSIIKVLNETYGIDLDEKDRVRVEQIAEEVKGSEEVQAVMTGNNSLSNKRHQVNRVIDKEILAQVHKSVDLYKKLSEKAVNATFKRHLFEERLKGFAGVGE